MNKKENLSNDNILVIIAILLTSLAFFVGYKGGLTTNLNKVDTIFHTDTFIKNDTLTIFKEKPTLKIVKTEKVDTFYTNEGKDTILKTENKQYQDTLCQDKDSIILKSFISGVNPNLDSLSVEWRKRETTITNTVEVTKYIEKKRTLLDRFSIGPAVTAGYDPINHNWGVVIGASVFFDIK